MVEHKYGGRVFAAVALLVALTGCAIGGSGYYDELRDVQLFAEATDAELDAIGQNICTDVETRSDADTLRVLRDSGMSASEAEHVLKAVKAKHCPEL